MNIKRFTIISLFTLLANLAQAHTHLKNSMPAAKSSGAAPQHIMLEFSEATQLTALTLQKEGGKEEQKLGPLPAKPDKMIHVAAPKLDPGAYILTWRAVGDDKHVMSGKVPFTVR